VRAAFANISGDYLKSAHPRLIARAIGSGLTGYQFEHHISQGRATRDEVVREGFDPDNSPLGPVYWRIVRRGDEKFYLSTCVWSRDEVAHFWGKEAISYCDPLTGVAVVQLETPLPNDD
jgi:hypothetical protein